MLKPITIFKKPLPKFFKFFSEKIWKKQTYTKLGVNQLGIRTNKPTSTLSNFFQLFSEKNRKKQKLYETDNLNLGMKNHIGPIDP